MAGKPFGTKHAFKDQKQIQDWLYSLTPKIKKFYREVFYNENLKITRAVLMKHQIAKDILQGLLKGKTEKGEETGPVPVQIVYGKYDKKPKKRLESKPQEGKSQRKSTDEESQSSHRGKEKEFLPSSRPRESLKVK